MKSTTLIQAMLGLVISVSALSSMASTDVSLLGEAASASSGLRTVTITSGMKYINVTGGETINFNIGGKTFTWTFDGTVASFDLQRIAPPGTMDHAVTAYISADPAYVD
ncbi:CzcE family metal-binding protein [Undibacterium sp. TJN25]|uniref:CzcE family metal-binding protein n=1 Tax=Undibacterium sp. TJN25 TaxID=3413056 RepID=UPI003BF10D4E